MSNNKPIYPRGQLAKTVRDVVSKYVGGVYDAEEVTKQVLMLMPKANKHSIMSLLTYEYPKRGWATERIGHHKYSLTDKFDKMNNRKSVEKPKDKVITKNPDDGLTFVEIGRGIVAYVNELKTLADIAEGDNVKLTKQVNKLQDAFNKMKLEGNGSIHVRDILKT